MAAQYANSNTYLISSSASVHSSQCCLFSKTTQVHSPMCGSHLQAESTTSQAARIHPSYERLLLIFSSSGHSSNLSKPIIFTISPPKVDFILPALKLVGQAGSFIAVEFITHEALIL